ncbi:MAG: restriction endonuclease subunit S [Treponema sp.]|nr:restriction endonuclease subunit S [Treponema sp.]
MLDTYSWQPFKLKDLFIFYRGKGITTAEISENQGNIPCIQSGENNNGIIGYMDNSFINDKNHTYIKAPFISVARSGTSGIACVQNKNSYIGDSVYALKLHKNENNLTYLFLVTLLNKERYRYGYGRKVSIEKYIETFIKLPIDKQGTPNWKYIENYINNLGINLPKTKNNGKNSPALKTQKWKEFKLSDIFDITYGNKFDLDKMSFEKPEINFISRTANNCGIVTKVDIVKGSNPFNASYMTIALGGSIGSTFYQNEQFYTAQNVAVLKDKEGILISKFAKFFIKTIIELEVGIKFRAFGRELNKHIKKNFPISLPVTIDETPDWQFMENYIKSLPYSDII